MFFIGIDLAWSEKNGSGVVVLKGDVNKAEFVCGNIFYSDDEILKFIEDNIGDKKALISIDAPLIVPNESGRRLAEDLAGKLFRKYDAGAHPANRKRLSSWTGKIRGEEISKLLSTKGFEHDPYIKKLEASRKFFEVYPHPSIVVLFKLDKILKYKNKPNRSYEFRWNEFKKYQNYLKSLKDLSLPKGVIDKNVKNLKGNALKDYEDLLDGIFCAYLSYYTWKNPEKCAVLGNMKKGYILTPVFEDMQKQLKDISSQRLIQ